MGFFMFQAVMCRVLGFVTSLLLYGDTEEEDLQYNDEKKQTLYTYTADIL